MKKPSSPSELKELFYSMEHRERFIFKLTIEQNNEIAVKSGYSSTHKSNRMPAINESSKPKYTCNGPDALEVYCTHVETKNGYEVNINIQLVDNLGKLYKADNGKTVLNRSKYLRLHGKGCFEQLFEFINA